MTTAKYNVWARHLTLLLSGLLFTTLSQAQSTVLINELDSVDADEFIELKGAPNASLNGYTLVLFASGSIATPADNKSYRAIALDGYHIRSTGYFVVGVQSAPNVDIVVMGAPLAASSLVGNVNSGNGFISNYFSAVALYSGVVTYPRGTPGAIASNVNLIDAVTHHPQRSVDKFLVATLTPGQLSINEHGEVFAYFQSIGRFPEVGAIANNTTSYRLLKPSSGMSNGIAPTFSTTGRSDVKMVFSFLTTVAPKAGIVNEGGISPTEGQVSKVTVKLQNKAGGVVIAPSDLAINVQSRDQSELVVQTAPIVIPAGKSSITFNLTAVPDGWKDGNQVVYFEATAPGCYDEQVAMTVKDVTAVQPVSPLIITEVNAREAGDANGDGAANEVDDQFIEIVNRSLATVDLSSKKLVVDGVDKFTFPAGSLLLAGRAAVVFADGVSNGIGQNGLVSGKDKFGCSLVFDAGLASGFGIDPSYGIVQIKGSSSVVVGAQISAAGTGYKAPVTVTFSGGGGSGAAGTATVVSGKITGLVITNAGSGYTSAPTITLAGATGSGTGAVAT
ncbi:MAG: lamin tail domain-containing protein, partial [Fimbriimonadaceae bacterium]